MIAAAASSFHSRRRHRRPSLSTSNGRGREVSKLHHRLHPCTLRRYSPTLGSKPAHRNLGRGRECSGILSSSISDGSEFTALRCALGLGSMRMRSRGTESDQSVRSACVLASPRISAVGLFIRLQTDPRNVRKRRCPFPSSHSVNTQSLRSSPAHLTPPCFVA